MSKYLIVLLVVVFTANYLSAQDTLNVEPENDKDIIQLYGVIRNDSLKSIPFSTIAVLNTGRGTASDFWGYFSIAVNSGDTIQFSSVGFKRQLYIVPNGLEGTHQGHDVMLETDTIMLAEATVFPWSTYDQFLQAVVDLELADEDMENARRNIQLMQRQMIDDEYQVDASLNYKYFMGQKYNDAYTAGQFPSVSLLNPFAWAQFFQALKSGLFKSKKKIY
ncbi:MAG: carboxypeptidase-like regulatory domain-containing protein [Bacteroidales bacterium]|nr:carboxypeptidase-like regulatory domain-containing protein [Bacteroidales bacterium]MCF8457896.1 carboxypeptidase-like regulatory domain-containing protein [Bacteroidales bacterium]